MLTPEGRGACVYTPATLCTELIMIHGTVVFSVCREERIDSRKAEVHHLSARVSFCSGTMGREGSTVPDLPVCA